MVQYSSVDCWIHAHKPLMRRGLCFGYGHCLLESQPVCEPSAPARSDTPQRMRNTIHVVELELCTPPALVTGYFYHI